MLTCILYQLVLQLTKHQSLTNHLLTGIVTVFACIITHHVAPGSVFVSVPSFPVLLPDDVASQLGLYEVTSGLSPSEYYLSVV